MIQFHSFYYHTLSSNFWGCDCLCMKQKDKWNHVWWKWHHHHRRSDLLELMMTQISNTAVSRAPTTMWNPRLWSVWRNLKPRHQFYPVLLRSCDIHKDLAKRKKMLNLPYFIITFLPTSKPCKDGYSDDRSTMIARPGIHFMISATYQRLPWGLCLIYCF